MSDKTKPTMFDSETRLNGATEASSDSHNDKPLEKNSAKADESPLERPAEFGGQKGPEPTRYGDWEKNGRCTDF